MNYKTVIWAVFGAQSCTPTSCCCFGLSRTYSIIQMGLYLQVNIILVIYKSRNYSIYEWPVCILLSQLKKVIFTKWGSLAPVISRWETNCDVSVRFSDHLEQHLIPGQFIRDDRPAVTCSIKRLNLSKSNIHWGSKYRTSVQQQHLNTRLLLVWYSNGPLFGCPVP